MKIGIDIDGVLANFYSAYEQMFVEEASEDKFPGRYPEFLPPVWNWPEYFGYDASIVKRVWQRIKRTEGFWEGLGPLSGVDILMERAPWVNHDVYFITNRPGVRPKSETERWLKTHLRISNPTVLIAKDTKAGIIRGLDLDTVIDDKYEHIRDVESAVPECTPYVLDRPYNRADVFGGQELAAKRVGTVEEWLDAEGIK